MKKFFVFLFIFFFPLELMAAAIPPPWIPDGSGGYYLDLDKNGVKSSGDPSYSSNGSLSVGGANPAAFDVDGDGTAEYILGDTVPSAANDTGTAGTIVFDATGGYIYFCTATDTWIRVQMATWP